MDVKQKNEKKLKFFSREDLAQIFSVTGKTIDHWVGKGVLPRPYKFGGQIRWSEEQIMNFLDKRKPV